MLSGLTPDELFTMYFQQPTDSVHSTTWNHSQQMTWSVGGLLKKLLGDWMNLLMVTFNGCQLDCPISSRAAQLLGSAPCCEGDTRCVSRLHAGYMLWCFD